MCAKYCSCPERSFCFSLAFGHWSSMIVTYCGDSIDRYGESCHETSSWGLQQALTLRFCGGFKFIPRGSWAGPYCALSSFLLYDTFGAESGLMEPFSQVEISHISEPISLPIDAVEKKLSDPQQEFCRDFESTWDWMSHCFWRCETWWKLPIKTWNSFHH